MDGVSHFKFHLSISFLLIWGLLIRLGSSGPPSSQIDMHGPSSGGGLGLESAVVAQFVTLNETFALKHLALDSLSGRVYVGAVNRLYELDANLRLDASVPTGPKLDNPNCHGKNIF
jgi:hypothetical protein